MGLGAPELLIILFLAAFAILPIYVTYRVLDDRDRYEAWKLLVVFFTGWIGALGFILFDRG